MWMRRTLGRCLTTIVGESAGARARDGAGRGKEDVGLTSLEKERSFSVVLRSMRDSSIEVGSELFGMTDLLHTRVLCPLQTLALKIGGSSVEISPCFANMSIDGYYDV